MSEVAILEQPSTEAVESEYAWQHKVGSYQLLVGKTPSGKFHPYILKDGRFAASFAAMSELADARRAVKAWYHQQVQDLLPGINQVDRELLEPIPVNRRIYYPGEAGRDRYASDVKEMAKSLNSETGYLSTLKVDEFGGIISGNIRWEATEGLKEKYPALPVEVKRYSTHWDKIQALILENRAKKRTKEQVEAEQLAVLAAEKELAEWRKENRHFLEDEVIRGEAADAAAEKLREAGISDDSGKTLKKKAYLNQVLTSIESEKPELVEKVKQIKDKSVESAYSLFKDVPEEDREAVVDRMIETGNIGGGRGKKSVKAVHAEIKAERIKREGREAGLDELFAIASSKGDDPENNRLTPKPIIELVQDLYGGEIDVDVFSEIEKKNVPALKHISILEDAFMVDWNIEEGTPAKIFANIPWKIPGDSIKRLRQQIEVGNVSEAVLIASNTILHSADCLNFIEDYAPVILPWRRGNGTKRLDFQPGTYLIHHKPEAVSGNSNKDVVFLYYGSQKQKFKDLFSDKGVPLVTEQEATKRVYSFWETLLEDWRDGKPVELKGHILKVQPNSNGLWGVLDNDIAVPGLDVAATEEEAKVMAIAHAILSKQQTFKL